MAINKIIYENNSLIDLTGDTATAANVLKNKIFHLNSGEIATGSMTNRGAVSGTISSPNEVYTIPKGYHNGNGTVTATYSGYNVVTGTYTGVIQINSFTISGLSFKPIGAVVFAMTPGASTNATLVIVGSSIPTENGYYGWRKNNSSWSITQRSSNPFVFNNDGFTMSYANGNLGTTYVYVAWG